MPQRCDARLISQFQMLSWLFLVVGILTFCQGIGSWGTSSWYPESYICGSVKTSGVCQCGNKTFVNNDYWSDTKCCGKGDCVALPDGGAVCMTGSVCSNWLLWNCGDTRISDGSKCKCGSVTLQNSSYRVVLW